MKIQYKFANETTVVEVDEKWGSIIVDLDRQEYNNNQKEKRRHCSLEALDPDGVLLSTDEDIEEDVVFEESKEKLEKAIESLTETQKAIVNALFFEGMTAVQYAQQCGISPGAIRSEKHRILKKLKKFF